MFYRLAGQFKSSYAADQQIFPIRQDRTFMIGLALIAFGVVPLVASAALTVTPTQVLALDTVQMTAVARNYSNAAVPRTFA